MSQDIYNIAQMVRAPKRFKYIIIHDTNCQWKDYQPFKVDKNLFQSGPMRARFKITKNFNEMPYHFVCEKIANNYQTFLARPLQYSCELEYPDLDVLYRRYGIHICVMGNYNAITSTAKLYQQLCYRVICPMMKTFRIRRSNIFLHGEVTKKDEFKDCPGFHFNKDTLFAFMNKYLMGTSS